MDRLCVMAIKKLATFTFSGFQWQKIDLNRLLLAHRIINIQKWDDNVFSLYVRSRLRLFLNIGLRAQCPNRHVTP